MTTLGDCKETLSDYVENLRSVKGENHVVAFKAAATVKSGLSAVQGTMKAFGAPDDCIEIVETVYIVTCTDLLDHLFQRLGLDSTEEVNELLDIADTAVSKVNNIINSRRKK